MRRPPAKPAAATKTRHPPRPRTPPTAGYRRGVAPLNLAVVSDARARAETLDCLLQAAGRSFKVLIDPELYLAEDFILLSELQDADLAQTMLVVGTIPASPISPGASPAPATSSAQASRTEISDNRAWRSSNSTKHWADKMGTGLAGTLCHPSILVEGRGRSD